MPNKKLNAAKFYLFLATLWIFLSLLGWKGYYMTRLGIVAAAALAFTILYHAIRYVTKAEK